ncbi:MAG TPA: glycosyl hydrolase family 28-related protein, partial [Candidatus Binatia bacterium]|nr:glycosyl hydrolase family 28-related protein [Candidatus Binatia bacterium]
MPTLRPTGVTPVNPAYPPGHLYRYGENKSPGVTDMTRAFEDAILANYGNTITVPDGTYLVGNLSPFQGAGTRVVGQSKYGTIIKAKAGTTGAIFNFASAASATSAFNEISNMRIDLNGEDCIAIDLSSCNNDVVRDVFIVGGTSIGTAI